jgi:hypothetical protein
MEKPMKSLLSLMLVGFAAAMVTPALAEDAVPTTQAECEKTPDMEWDVSQGKCVEQSPGG